MKLQRIKQRKKGLNTYQKMKLISWYRKTGNKTLANALLITVLGDMGILVEH